MRWLGQTGRIRVLGWVAISVVVLALAGCGSSRSSQKNESAIPAKIGKDTERFSATGMALHFLYPSTFQAAAAVAPAEQAGANDHVIRARVILSSINQLFVSDYSGLNVPVTPANAKELQPDFNKPVAQLAGHALASTIHVVNGHVEFEWPRFASPTTKTALASGFAKGDTEQINNIFIGDSEYELDCESTPQALAQVTAACTEALNSITG